ncbi:hypothetical protein [Endozoicomonas sp. 8E]|uniref:hypothetical protein n=1 Tax=Endozoicomonas sp. 8E TaxID=3035692 RepID=UPI00293902F2|nr:hypothetical protein [Endozoicomonas sp. 8E]WOG29940.1 hypothetical protein P6910_09870 [Endozoicomonas sp. 8E]
MTRLFPKVVHDDDQSIFDFVKPETIFTLVFQYYFVCLFSNLDEAMYCAIQ